MKYRSWLVVSGASEVQLGAAFGTGADCVVVDLADTVPHEARARARQMGAEWLTAHRTNLFGSRGMSRWVRVNALESGCSREDLAAVMAGAPDGVILPRAAGPEAVRHLASEIYELEQHFALPAGSTRILPVVGETPVAAMQISHYLEAAHQRLCGLTWSEAGLAASLGATSAREGEGSRSDVSRFVRAQTLLTAHAAHIVAIEAPCRDCEDETAIKAMAQRARADGFTGMFAVHPRQVDVINLAFTPGIREIEEAQEIVAAFEMNPHAVSLPLRGRTVERAELVRAQRVAHLAETEIFGNDARRRSILRPA
ncbi:HpcH/HpaI aldolase/citrate lyase family protein [Novosphingobium album (ex Hu et al. 2023)]|uniref:CoA ester lyase n=1 Tax=Novosphingobium album (ex Hu et al. 2023) TaxID=2930093 RepID=A0ABT0B057_9SPHN|nr:CoA ester lyase [Novosphingobium album (ex Hu et al. 2023)]MCJ2178447.1 CoA ester lyase [Novosphingobium album (ex Hu et al. 2023)]